MRIPILCSFLICIAACQPEPMGLYPGQADKCRGGQCYTAYYPGQEIALAYDSADLVIEGLEIVSDPGRQLFAYAYVKNDLESLSNDEYQEFFRFSVDTGLTDFLLTFPEDFAHSKATVQAFCQCPTLVWPVEFGQISGTHTGPKTWELDFNITHEGIDGRYKTLVFEATYLLAE